MIVFQEIIDELILACENQNWETAKLLLDLCDEREVDVDVKVISVSSHDFSVAMLILY